MKILNLVLVVLVSFQFSFSQNLIAYREASLNSSAQYSLQGNARIEQYDDGSFRFTLDSNYLTQSGPDVQIFLTNNSTFSSPIDTVGTLLVENIGSNTGISHFSGSYSKVISGITSLSDFDHVVFVCVQFGNLHWGNGSFGSIIPVTVTSSHEVADKVNINVYPNPVSEHLTINGPNYISSIQLYNHQGKIVLLKNVQRSNSIELDVEGLSQGLYSLVIESSDQEVPVYIQKISIQD